MMANLLVEKDNTSSNQISTRDIEGCFKTVGLELDKSVLTRLVKLTEIKRNHCSIPRIIEMIKKGTNPSENETGLGNIKVLNVTFLLLNIFKTRPQMPFPTRATTILMGVGNKCFSSEVVNL